jgi:RNA polymerase sigma factor (sigma-70 family)
MKSIKGASIWNATAVKEDERLRRLIEADWDSISAILYSRTKAALRKRRFRGELGGPVPGGHEVEDFIQEAVAEAYTSTSMPGWDGEQASLVKFLLRIILRHMKRYGARHENKKEQRSTTNQAEVSSQVADMSAIPQSCYPEPEDYASECEELASMLERFQEKHDYKIVEVILCDNALTPQEIAEKLSIKVEEVNNAKRRLKRDPYLQSMLRTWVGKKTP